LRGKLLPVVCLLIAGVLVVPAGARAQEDQPLEASLLVSAGGSIDEDSAGLGNSGFQLGLSLRVDRRTKVGARYGEIGYGAGDRVGTVFNPTFSYLTIGGEYSFSEGYYESGIYLALGAYRLEGTELGQSVSDSTVGLALGVTGEFEITRRLGFVLEASGHFADFAAARYFITFHGGLAYHF
jgi:hypothetical protein